MSLSTGTRIGPYTIGDEIGSGGMGVVYRATDQNLKRDVAIKALPESFSADADWVARFEREAQTLAALNHPNIAQIYGLERADGTMALAMELIEGPTLGDRIANGPLPPDEALGIAMQVADALEAAHGQGIVHRDLKPANIKLRPDGTVKVLDFGIAKTLDIRAASGQPVAMTTPAMTQTGVILGTAAYMSPEQARGRPIDQRTDIWAFGCVLFEMLTGQPAFAGEDVAITLARILANDTDLMSLPGVVSPSVRRAIALCLQKDERKRIADIRDVRLALAGELDVAELASGSGNDVPIGWRRLLPATAIAVVVTSIAAASITWTLWPLAEPDLVNRFDFEPADGAALRPSGRSVIAVSPDGRQFVYAAEDGLYLRAMGELEARLILGTGPTSFSPVFSPDGQFVAYGENAGTEIKRIAVTGGAPVVIADVGVAPFGISWEQDNTILFSQFEGIYRISANGGTPELVIPAEPGEGFYGPRLLPTGDVMFSVTRGTWGAAQIAVQSLVTGERTIIIPSGRDARYVSSGHLVYAQGESLFGVVFDPDSREISGGSTPLVQGVMGTLGGQSGAANYDVAEDGTLVYVPGFSVTPNRTLVWVDRDGRDSDLGAPPRTYAYPRMSPDGSKVALDIRDQDLDIWTWDFQRRTLERLTVDPGEDEFPAWTPDGRRIAFSSSRDGGSAADSDLFWQAADGAGSPELIVSYDGMIFPTAFLSDGSGVLLRTTPINDGANDEIAIYGFEDGELTPLIPSAFQERNAEISRDGQWLAYSSDRSGREEIYVRPFPDVEARSWQVSNSGGVQPLWSRNSDELFYRNGDAMMVVSYEANPSFDPGQSRLLFEGAYLGGETNVTFDGRSYDISNDGDRFLMIKQAQLDTARQQIVIVQNWFTELERLVPTE